MITSNLIPSPYPHFSRNLITAICLTFEEVYGCRNKEKISTSPALGKLRAKNSKVNHIAFFSGDISYRLPLKHLVILLSSVK